MWLLVPVAGWRSCSKSTATAEAKVTGLRPLDAGLAVSPTVRLLSILFIVDNRAAMVEPRQHLLAETLAGKLPERWRQMQIVCRVGAALLWVDRHL